MLQKKTCLAFNAHIELSEPFEGVIYNADVHYFVMVVAGKAQQLIQGLTATGDEGQQLSAVIELCQVYEEFISTVKYHKHLSPGCASCKK